MNESTPYLIIGLGNPGANYAHNRHNAGALFVAHLITQWNAPALSENRKLSASLTRTTAPCGTPVVIAQPTTYMNDSGIAVQAISNYYNIPASQIIVAHDDSDFIIGKNALQHDRGAAGHNGIKSTIAQIGTQAFHRLRIGVRPDLPADAPRKPAISFVLKDFTKNESQKLPEIFTQCEELITTHLRAQQQ